MSTCRHRVVRYLSKIGEFRYCLQNLYSHEPRFDKMNASVGKMRKHMVGNRPRVLFARSERPRIFFDFMSSNFGS